MHVPSHSCSILEMSTINVINIFTASVGATDKYTRHSVHVTDWYRNTDIMLALEQK